MAGKDDLTERIEQARQKAQPKRAKGSGPDAGGAAARALGFSATLVAAVLLGLLIGFTLDKLLGTEPWALLIFLGFGTAAGFLNIIREARRMTAQAEADTRRDDSEG